MTSAPMTATVATPALTFWDLPEDITRYIMELTMPTLNEVVLRVADKVEEMLSKTYTDTEDLDARRINQQYHFVQCSHRLKMFDIVGDVIASLDAKEYSNLFKGKSNASIYLYEVFNNTYDVDFVEKGKDKYYTQLVGYGNATYKYEDSEEEYYSEDSDDE